MNDIGHPRAIWLDAPQSPSRPGTEGVMWIHVGGTASDGSDLASLLRGYEIVVTADVPRLAPLLREYRWIRGVVGIAPNAVVDWEEAHSLSLLTETVRAEQSLAAIETNVSQAVAAITCRLQAFDALAEGWEGT